MRFRNALATLSSVLFAVFSLPLPADLTPAQADLREVPRPSPKLSRLLSKTAAWRLLGRRQTDLPIPISVLRERRRLQELHYAVSSAKIAPIWQNPRHRLSKPSVRSRRRLLSMRSSDESGLRSSVSMSQRRGRVASEDAGLNMASIALSLVGSRYEWGGESLSGFDCSGLAQYVCRKVGIVIPRTTWDQFVVGQYIPIAHLRPGDLVFFNTDAPGASHVAIYVGNGLIVQALNERTGVIVSRLSSPYFRSRFLGARRMDISV